MTLRFGGARYQFQCPVCHFSLAGRKDRQIEVRIQEAAGLHDQGCPGRSMDPVRLQKMTAEQVRAALEPPAQ